MATQSSILAWRIPWTEKHDKLQSTGLQRVGHDLATFTYQNRRLGCRHTEVIQQCEDRGRRQLSTR